MPESTFTYSDLLDIVEGYQNCIISFRGLTGSAEEWRDIGGPFAFSAAAKVALVFDCAKFLTAAHALHPDGYPGLRSDIGCRELGWRFFMTRQCQGLGYEGLVGGGIGRRLNELAESFVNFEVGLAEGQIVFFP